MTYLILKYLHILGAMVILGTGIGIAFFMLMAHLTRDTAFIARTAWVVVMADFVFTATAVIAQPVTDYFLIREAGIPFDTGWVVASLALYVFAGLLSRNFVLGASPSLSERATPPCTTPG